MKHLSSLAAAALLAFFSIGANALCDVSLVSMLPGNQAALKANCGEGVTAIQWFRHPTDIPGDNLDTGLVTTTTLSAATSATVGTDVYYTTTLYPGVHTYTAKATAGEVVVLEGLGVTIAISAAPPTIGNAPDQNGSTGTPFSLGLASYVSNSHGTVTYSVTGDLPAGLSLNSSTGVISGTPTTAATSTVTWTAVDTNGAGTPPDSIQFTISAVPPPTIGNAPDQPATVGTAFNLGLASYVSNSHGTVTYSVTGTLPAGLTLNSSTGAISGTPTTAGVSTVTWTATDNNGAGSPADSIQFTVSAVPPPTIGNAPDQTPTIGTAFNLGLASYVSNSHGTVTYSVTGTLPAGLSLNSSTGAISGTPTTAGTSTVTWTATDSNGTGSPADSVQFTVSAGGCSGGSTVWANFSNPGRSTSGSLSGSGTVQNKVSYSFNMSSSIFGTGAQILLNVYGTQNNAREHFISDCPGDFTNPPTATGATNTTTYCSLSGYTTGTILLAYPTQSASYKTRACILDSGRTYYFNIRTMWSASQGSYLATGYLLDTDFRY